MTTTSPVPPGWPALPPPPPPRPRPRRGARLRKVAKRVLLGLLALLLGLFGLGGVLQATGSGPGTTPAGAPVTAVPTLEAVAAPLPGPTTSGSPGTVAAETTPAGVGRSAAPKAAAKSSAAAGRPAPKPAPRPAPKPAPKPAAKPQPLAAAGPSTTTRSKSTSARYANCAEVRAAGAAPIRRGDPGYSSKLDRDGDGVGCETG